MAEIVLALATSHTPQSSVADRRLPQTKDETGFACRKPTSRISADKKPATTPKDGGRP